MSTHYTPVDASGFGLIAACVGCRRDVVTSASNRVGDKYMCCHCRARADVKAAA
jgi:hypothetical protein